MAIEEEVLSQISRSVDRVSSSSESFRIVAGQQNASLQRAVKDISSMFRAQSSNQEELNSAIGDLRDEMSQTNDKTDAVAARLNDTINVQSSMLSELQGIGRSISQLNNMMQQMFMQGGGGGSGGGGGGGLGGGGSGSSIGSVLAKILIGGAGVTLGVGAAAALNQWRAGQERGGMGAPTPQSSPTPSGNSPTPPGNSATPNQSNSEDKISGILAAIKQKESGGEQDPYTSIARGRDNKPLPLGSTTGTGAYQFTPGTWKDSARAANIDVSQYPQARDAPAELQDRVAKERAAYLLKKAGGDISLVPAFWNGGENIDVNNMSPAVMAYQKDVMTRFQQQQQQQPNSSPGTSMDYAEFLRSRAAGGVDAEKLNPSFAAKLMRAIEEAERVTGEKVTITSGFRTPEQQAQLYANFIKGPYTYQGKVYTPNGPPPPKAAPPGKSQHETGHAVDLSLGKATDYIRQNAAKFGLMDLAGDPPHFSDSQEEQTTTSQSAVGASPEIAQQTQTQTQMSAGQSSLMAGLEMPAGMGPGSEPSRIGMGDMDSYNPAAILASMAGGNMFGPSGRVGAIGAALGVSNSLIAGLQSRPDTRASELNQAAMDQSAQSASPWKDPGAVPGYQPPSREEQNRGRRIDPDTYNHPEDRTVSPSWMDRLLGIYPNETSGVNTTYVE